MTRIGTRVRIYQYQLHARLKALQGWWLSRPTSLLDRYERAMQWIRRHSVRGGGISVTDLQGISYPEVSGYFIPTLLDWGERDLAARYARWLVSIQNPTGSWSDAHGRAPYTFDSGQVLRGLLALVDDMPELQGPIGKGCDWILSQIEPSGQVTTPDKSFWRLADGAMLPEGVHLYALEPLRIAGRKWKIDRYCEAVDRAVRYHLRDHNLTRFDTLSHFHAYTLEALVDLGFKERAAEGMEEIAAHQRRGRNIPAHPGVKWTCSTGLFQYAVVWYKLGELALANRAFEAGCALQNASGGFYGSRGKGATYFPHEEISWAVKYFLDALHWKVKTSIEAILPALPDQIDADDGRYRLIADAFAEAAPRRVLDAGCGKGRFARKLKESHPDSEVVGMDLSEKVLGHLAPGLERVTGSLLNIPFPDQSFDMTYCVEALEHAINIPAAIAELGRVVRPNGTLVIIDKNEQQQGALAIPEWEQWFDEHQITALLQREGFSVTVKRNLSYNAFDGSDALFLGWVARKTSSPRAPSGMV